MNSYAASRNAAGYPNTYDPFAAAYSLYWERASLNWLRPLSVLLIPRLSRRARVLDLCCGTGVLAAELSARGFRVVGLDGSRSMLRYARVNASSVGFVQADARCFGLRAHFDAVTCVFDSLNHLLSQEELRAAFSCVAACLRPGGWFLFDLNSELGYLLHWNGAQELGNSDHRARTQSHYDEQSGFGVFTADLAFREAGESVERQVVLWQRCHPDEEVQTALRAAGFRQIEAYGLEGDALVSGSLERAERVFYLCRRPLPARRPQRTGRVAGSP